MDGMGRELQPGLKGSSSGQHQPRASANNSNGNEIIGGSWESNNKASTGTKRSLLCIMYEKHNCRCFRTAWRVVDRHNATSGLAGLYMELQGRVKGGTEGRHCMGVASLGFVRRRRAPGC